MAKLAVPTEIVTILSDQLDDVYSSLLRVVLYGLKVSRQLVKKQKTFPLLFDALSDRASPAVAAAITIHVLERFGFKKPTGLEPFADQNFVIKHYREVDLRLTVAGFFFNIEKDKLAQVFLDLSENYLNNLARDEMNSVTEVVEMLCSRGVITTDNISPLQEIARHHHQPPGYFTKYCQRYNPSSGGATIDIRFIQNLPQNADEVIYPLKRISFDEKNIIGEGCFETSVYRGEHNNTEVAVKKIYQNVFSVSEKKLMIKCDGHPNIIQYHCIERDSTCYYLAFELCLCTLKQYIENREKYQQTLHNISDFQIIKEILSGLKFLHENNIIHRDIRPSNILLTDRPSPKAVISDFGISRCIQKGRQDITTSGRKGTQGWIAPELYKKGTKLTLAIDIFSLGCLIYYVLTNGEHPFDYDEYNVTNSKYDLRLLNDTVVEQITAKSLIKQMIYKDPNHRPSISGVCDHCFLWDVKQQMEFFQYASDWIDTLCSDDTIKKDFENNASRVFTRNWKDMINEDLRQDLEQQKYDGTSLNELLRAIRNKCCHHYNATVLLESFKADRFKSCDELVSHFTSCFPSLLIVTYDFMKKHNMLTQTHKFNHDGDSLNEFQYSLYISQQTIKSLQEALLDTKEELNKQMNEKESLIARMTHKVLEHTLVNELEEKDKVISKLIRKLQKAEEIIREKKQDEERKLIDESIDDITFELEQKNAIIANLSNELKSLKESNKLIHDDKSTTQLVHDNDCQFTLDDVSKLMVILPVEDDWYQLGHHLDMEESTLRDAKQTDIPLEYLLHRWCSEGGSLMKLENALISIDRTDLISGLRQLKYVTKRDVGIQFNYMTPSLDSLDDLNDEHIAGKKLFLIQGDGPQLMDWEEYGLRIGVSKGSLPPSETAEIAVVALVGGHFVFPKKTQLVSTIYALSVSRPLNEPLRLDVQHCVNIRKPSQRKYLKFAIAPLNRPSVPYQFKVVEGGEFSVNSFYGSIHRQKFSLVAILAENSNQLIPDPILPLVSNDDDEEDSSSNNDTNGKDEHSYGFTSNNEITTPNDSKPVEFSLLAASDESSNDSFELVYVGMLFNKKTVDSDISSLALFITTRNLNALIQYVKETNSHAEMEQCIQYNFQKSLDYIELKFDNEHQDIPCTGWIITPLQKPYKLFKNHIDNFGSNLTSSPASFSISVHSINSPDTVPVLSYEISLEGTDPPVTIFIHRVHTGILSSGSGAQFKRKSLLESSITRDVDAVEEIGQEPKRRKLDPDLGSPCKRELLYFLQTISHKWELIGVALEIEENVIEGLEQNENDNMRRLSHILDAWFAKDDVTWRKIIDVVGGPIVRKKNIANEIREFLGITI